MRRSFLFSAPIIAIAALSTCGVVELPRCGRLHASSVFRQRKADGYRSIHGLG